MTNPPVHLKTPGRGVIPNSVEDWTIRIGALRDFLRFSDFGRCRFSTVFGITKVDDLPRHSSLVIHHGLRLCCALLLIAPLRAQLGLPPEADLFGDEIVRRVDPDGGNLRDEEEDKKEKPKTAGFEHALVFQDGRQLRGKLVELTKNEVVWQRPDALELLRFPRDEVRRVTLVAGTESNQSRGRNVAPAVVERYVRMMVLQVFHGLGEMIGEAVAQVVTSDLGRAVRIPNIVQLTSRRMVETIKQVEGAESGASEAPEPKPDVATATLKLPGGDWLFGEVTSADGETFALKLADGTALAIPRAPLEWLHFGTRPAPAFGFAGSGLDLESWPVRTPGTRMEIAGGTLTLRDGGLLGRTLSPPKRFEVAFEVPEDSEDGLRLWIQPIGPQTNCYTTGTIQLLFGKKELSSCIYIQKFEHKKSPVPKESAEQKGPVNYRVLYDGAGRHLAVLRNGVQLGDWKFIEDEDKDAKNPPGNREEREIMINGLCFDRENRGSKDSLQFNRLRVQPWDGVVPAAGETEPDGDWLSVAPERPVTGRLESISADALVFSGTKIKREEETFVRLRGPVSSLAEADAMLIFGQQGEVSVAGLEIRDGRARGRTAFAPEFVLPTAALQTVVFPSRAANAAIAADALIFKNGDELRGTLRAAMAGGAVRWKMAGGREIELQSTRLAGVRFAGRGEPLKEGRPAATVELRNGDRLRGEFVGLDEKQLQFQHAQFGTVQLAREWLWCLFPNSHFAVSDGGGDAAAWIEGRRGNGESPAKAEAAPWTVLDGHYIQRGQRNNSGSDDARSLNVPLKEIPERFEVRAEATDVNGNPPSFGLTLGTKDGKTSLQVSFNYFNLSLYMNSPKSRGRNSYKNVSIRDKVPDASSRLALRAFVDRKAGTADLFLNGALVARVGQQASERLPGIGEVASFSAGQQEEGLSILSNLWMGPWNGELPRLGDGVPANTALTNGDAAPGVPEKWQDGTFLMETAAGPLALPLEKVQAIEFGGAMTPEKAPGRVRLADGCTLNVGTFRWDGTEFTAHSETLGELRLPAVLVSELIFNPSPVRPPRQPVAKKLAQKVDDAEAGEKPAVLLNQ